MSVVYVSIGSNLGDRRENCMRAVDLLKQNGIRIRKMSSLYETEPWGVKDQPGFLNMAIEIDTELEPVKLLRVLKDVEASLGRQKSFKWGPRLIDLDILLYDDIVLDEPGLKIPHPFMHERDFVLRPLNEMAPDAMHPLLKLSVHELFARLQGKRASSGIS
jgi:2-amino-4-hydroxy-6-hydroxymethyldihydropteridine diphosphokinase